MTWSTIID